MRKIVPLLVLFGLSQGFLFAQAETGKTASYSEQLNALLSEDRRIIRPKDRAADVDTIRPGKGAAGLEFGDSIDDMVKLWGKPTSIEIRHITPYWVFHVGANSFKFYKKKLVSVAIHSAASPDAKLDSGIGFGATLAEVKAKYPDMEKNRFHWVIVSDEEYETRFTFFPNRGDPDDDWVLGVIEVKHPDANRLR